MSLKALNSMSKTLEKIAALQMMSLLSTNDALSPCQSGLGNIFYSKETAIKSFRVEIYEIYVKLTFHFPFSMTSEESV